jgi:Dyp-type peroxidase family
MAVELKNDAPISEKSPEHQGWLEKLQGNILTGHGRRHSAHILLRLPDDEAAAGAVVGRLARYVTSARQQYLDSDAFRASDRKAAGRLFGSLSISASGYEALGYKKLDKFPEVWKEAKRFAAGMREPVERSLGDPPVDQWQQEYRRRVDVLLLLAGSRLSRLKAEVTRVVAGLAPSELVCVEWGQVFRNRDGQAIEHFGFVDGRSQPLFLQRDFRSGAAWPDGSVERRDERPIDAWNPFAPLGTALVVDPLGDDSESLGSFLVFRKLEQDVRAFVDAERALAGHLGLRGAGRGRAGAMVVGRFRDGSPLTCAPEQGWQPPTDNNFTYQEDLSGWRCPRYAHVRRANPRGSSLSGLDQERSRRIVRRGVTYGEPTRGVEAALRPTSSTAAVEALPSKDVGILFMAYQADIELQFAAIQRDWFSAYFPGVNVPVDILSGRATGTQSIPWVATYNAKPTTRYDFPASVRFLGGEYFFTPSLSFLRRLDQRWASRR